MQAQPQPQKQQPNKISGKSTDKTKGPNNGATYSALRNHPGLLTPSQLLVATQTAALMAATAGLPVGFQASSMLFNPNLFSAWPTASLAASAVAQQVQVQPKSRSRSRSPTPMTPTTLLPICSNNQISLSKIDKISDHNIVSSSSNGLIEKRRKAVKITNNNNNNNNNINNKNQSKSLPNSPTLSSSNHTSVALKSKNFKCTTCNRSFGYKHVLQNHERTHTGEKPFECQLCHKKFTRDHHLKTHMRLHTGEKPYRCTYCDRFFVQVANLRRHLRVHTGNKPYECDTCMAKFADSNQLKSHMLIHTNEKPFACRKCDNKFRRKHHLDHHRCRLNNNVHINNNNQISIETNEEFIKPLNDFLPEQTEPEDLSIKMDQNGDDEEDHDDDDDRVDVDEDVEYNKDNDVDMVVEHGDSEHIHNDNNSKEFL